MVESSLVQQILDDPYSADPDMLAELVRRCAASGRIENNSIELKVTLDNDAASQLNLIKDIVSIANFGGGAIIFGIDKNGQVLGCPHENISRLDPTDLQNGVRKRAPQASLSSAAYTLMHNETPIIVLLIRRSDQIIVFEKDGNYQDSTKETKPVFRAGTIYSRSGGGNALASQGMINSMIEQHVQERLTQRIALIQQVATLPTGSNLVVVDPSNQSEGTRLVQGSLGIPVHITDRPNEDTLGFAEVLDANVPFADTNHEMAAATRLAMQTDYAHYPDARTLAHWYFSRLRLQLPAERASVALISACRCFGFPMFWASVLDPDTLESMLGRLSLEYPSRTFVPYIICSFYWSRREEMLKSMLHSGVPTMQHSAFRLLAIKSFEDFRRNARFPGKTFRIGNQAYRIDRLAADREAAQALFDVLMEQAMKGELREGKQSANQLDIMLHARLS